MLDLLFDGLGGSDAAYTLLRVSVGGFYAIAGAHKLLRREDHTDMVDAMRTDVTARYPVPLAWFVSSVEFLAGSAVVIGLLTPLAAIGLLAVSLVALATDERKRIADWKPTDPADWVDDYLYLPACLYAVMLAMVAAYGSGPYGLDAMVRALF